MAKPETTDQTQSTPNDVGWRPRPSRVPPEDRMTYEEFLAWADEDTHAEWVDGVVEMPSPVSWRHEQITNFLVTVLSTYVRIHSLGAIAGGPFQMKLASTGREPDVLFIATEHLDHVKANYLDGPADLVVEVVSPESVARDRRNKVAEYQAAGIPEYWLIDPLTGNATFYQLDASGQYQSVPPDNGGLYHSQTLSGFRLRVAWLWQDPLPDPTAALLDIDREAYGAYLKQQLEQAGLS